MITERLVFLKGETLNVKKLANDNLEDIKCLCNRSRDYFLMVDKKLPDEATAISFLKDLPPGKTYEDKYLLGIYSSINNKLIALVDIIKDYHNIGEWMLGLLLIDEQERRRGLGIAIHDFIKDWVKEYNGHLLKVGVLEVNSKALKFWSKIGYQETRRVNMEFGGVDEVVIVMEQQLK